MSSITETQINLVGEGSRLEGKIILDHTTRVYGTLVGEVHSKEGSSLLLGETGVIEGNVYADQLWVDGYIRGDLVIKSKVVISRTGRVIGNIRTPNIQVEFGAFFEGECDMKNQGSDKPSIE